VYRLEDREMIEKLSEMTRNRGYCNKHKNVNEIYCMRCGIMLCMECHLIEQDHSGHKLYPLKNSGERVE